MVAFGLVTCVFFLQLGLENWVNDGLIYRFVDKTNEKVLEHNYSNAIETVSLNFTSKPLVTPLEPKPTTLLLLAATHPSTASPITVHNGSAGTRTSVNNITVSRRSGTAQPVAALRNTERDGNVQRHTAVAINASRHNLSKIKVKPMLTPEQTLRILGNAIAALPVIPSEKVVRVLVATYFRSGSTFLGDVLQQNWKTFYHFEPLHYMSDGLRVKANQTEEAISLLEDIFRCNYSTQLAAKYLKWGSDQKHAFLFKRNRFLWVACRMQPKNCFRPDFNKYICERAPIQVMKVNRLHLRDVKKLVEDNPELDIRVVNLVRDPRGTISSRKVLEWCNTTSCSDFRVLCSEMNDDYESFQKLASLKPDRFFQVRYEDLSRFPERVTKNMFSALGLPYSSSVSRFLRTNTKARAADRKDPYSTRRNSSTTPFEFRRKIPLAEIKKIQIGCKRVITNYRYEFLNKTEDLDGPPPVLAIGDRPWWIKP